MSSHQAKSGAQTDGEPYWVGNIQYQRYYCNAHPNRSVSIPVQIGSK